jgi:hypothetical protein
MLCPLRHAARVLLKAGLWIRALQSGNYKRVCTTQSWRHMCLSIQLMYILYVCIRFNCWSAFSSRTFIVLCVWMYIHTYIHMYLAARRVTRLGEFWPIGCFFLLGSIIENYRNSPNFRLLCISAVKVTHQFWRKTGWATFWAAFTQTHQVTLADSHQLSPRSELKLSHSVFPPTSKLQWIRNASTLFFKMSRAWQRHEEEHFPCLFVHCPNGTRNFMFNLHPGPEV